MSTNPEGVRVDDTAADAAIPAEGGTKVPPTGGSPPTGGASSKFPFPIPIPTQTGATRSSNWTRTKKGIYLHGTLKPKMGGLIDRVDYAVPWTGGKPDKFWMALEEANPSFEPNQMRSMDSKAAYAYNLREADLYSTETDKFKKGDSTTVFIRKLDTFFHTHGMDTILYRKDPLESGEYPLMINILVEYARLSLSAMKKQHMWFFDRFDHYDVNNSKQACLFLLNLLDSNLQNTILDKLGSHPQDFAILLTFLDQVRPHTVESGRARVNGVLTLNPSDPMFPQQNITMFCNKVRPLLQELQMGNLSDSLNNLQLCRTLANAGGSDNKEYATPLFNMLCELDSASIKITHLDNKGKCAALTAQDLYWDDILDKAEVGYLSQTTEGANHKQIFTPQPQVKFSLPSHQVFAPESPL
jgi:hypothetical protein